MNEDLVIGKFTLETYLEYLKAPQWVRDGFDSETEYKSTWCNQVKNWYDQSDNASRTVRDIWTTCYKALTQPTMRSANSSPTFEDNISAYRIPILKSECLDEVAGLYANDYIPTLTPLIDQAKPMTLMGNQYLKQEFLINCWRSIKFTLGVDAFVTDMWVVKTNTSDDAPGPFGQERRVTIKRVDPRNCFPDNKAPSLEWQDMDFFIVTESMDLGVARNRFKKKAAEITMTLAEPDKTMHKRYTNSQLVTLPGMKGTSEAVTDRARVQIKECWFHDERYEFVAEKYEDVGGVEKIKIDDEGYVVGAWKKAYPHGRMIVTAGDMVILEDIANPFWHKQMPFIVMRANPDMGELLTVGKAADILGIERRVNDFECRVHSYGQSEIERPMQADVGALPTNISMYRTTGQSRAILLKTAGKTFERPAPVEVPQFVAPYLARCDGYTQRITGRPAIMQGRLTEGSQIGAQGMQDTQAYGASRMGMESIFIAEAMRKLGFQVFELIRETYPKDLSAVVMLPDGTEEELDWNSDVLNSAYFMEVNLAANTPGGKQANSTFLTTLYDKGLTDDIFTLQGMGVDGWQDVIRRKRARLDEEIFEQAAGRAAGLQIKSLTKLNEKPGQKAGL